jgi:hypothetical protein
MDVESCKHAKRSQRCFIVSPTVVCGSLSCNMDHTGCYFVRASRLRGISMHIKKTMALQMHLVVQSHNTQVTSHRLTLLDLCQMHTFEWSTYLPWSTELGYAFCNRISFVP